MSKCKILWYVLGMYIKVRVVAGAKKEIVIKRTEDHFDIAVKEKAERNMANRKVAELIAEEFNVPFGKVRITSGHKSPGKIISIDI
ncbi:MAG: DUF167 domain-containing protein [Candidatus Paceibacterota bacterium]|jgi:uncharacterized protein YggU (UPF0235/DUF167 family)